MTVSPAPAAQLDLLRTVPQYVDCGHTVGGRRTFVRCDGARFYDRDRQYNLGTVAPTGAAFEEYLGDSRWLLPLVSYEVLTPQWRWVRPPQVPGGGPPPYQVFLGHVIATWRGPEEELTSGALFTPEVETVRNGQIGHWPCERVYTREHDQRLVSLALSGKLVIQPDDAEPILLQGFAQCEGARPWEGVEGVLREAQDVCAANLAKLRGSWAEAFFAQTNG